MAATPEHQHLPALGGGALLISDARKQMLMDNLQLEVTERARKLRAQYALQAQGLRARLEMRVNRIPHSLRNITMQELADKYSQPSKAVDGSSTYKVTYPSIPAGPRGTKRSSDSYAAADKENDPPTGQLENPKKRAKTVATVSSAPAKGARAVSRKVNPSMVLSPKSHNSRTLPVSPIKIASPVKIASPFKSASPLKPSIIPKPSSRAAGPAAAKAARPASRQTARPTARSAQPPSCSGTAEPVSDRPSSSSELSTATTVVKKPTVAVKTTAAAAKKATTVGTIRSKTAGGIKSALSSLTGSKRGASTTKKSAAAPATTTAANAASGTTVGGRTLRKRGAAADTPRLDNDTESSAHAEALVPKAVAVRFVSKDEALAMPSPQVAVCEARSGTPPPVPPKDAVLQRRAEVIRTRIRAAVKCEELPSQTRTGIKGGQSGKRRSSGTPKRLGSRRLARVVDKGLSIIGRSSKRIAAK